jgi:hypothetical protein
MAIKAVSPAHSPSHSERLLSTVLVVSTQIKAIAAILKIRNNLEYQSCYWEKIPHL